MIRLSNNNLAPWTIPMPIPERLKPQPVGEQLFDEMSTLCDAIEREPEAGETAEALLQRWHSHARRHCDPYEFRTYWKAVSKETFVRDALNPEPSFDKDVVYSEAVAILEAVTTVALPKSEISVPDEAAFRFLYGHRLAGSPFILPQDIGGVS